MGILNSSRNPNAPSALFEFTQGIAVDSRLCEAEVKVQIEWARGLMVLGLLSANEFSLAESTLQDACEKMKNNTFPWRVEDEDIHMNLERYMTDQHGELGKKIHLGRSRNDLIATTLRLFVAHNMMTVQNSLKELGLSFLHLAKKNESILVPGLTHLQHGQAVLLGHTLCAHAWAFSRDLERLDLAKKEALHYMPLGAAALSGTPLKMDLQTISQNLGFQKPLQNSYDAVGDRDFMLSALNALATLAMHMSRYCEDIIYASSSAVKLIDLPKEWSTGSSIMPNKRNPDVPELVRAKTAHIISSSQEAYSLMKGVASSYGSDLHELKSVYMRALDETLSCLSILPSFIHGLKVNTDKANSLLEQGHILATEVADRLVEKGHTFREAYKQVAFWVEDCESKQMQIHQHPEVMSLFPEQLTFAKAVEKRSQSGGSSSSNVRQQLQMLESIFLK